MKVVCISDTHGQHRLIDIPEGDLLIHAGDLGENASHSYDFLDWFGSLPHKNKVCIAGNHDFLIEARYDNFMNYAIKSGVTYLEDSEIIIEGLKIYGSPWSRNLPSWAFQVQDKDAFKLWHKIPNDTDILITHGPAYGIGDKLGPMFARKNEDSNVGCKALLERIREVNPKLHVFGHIHKGRNRYDVLPGTISINASVLNEAYDLYPAKPFVIEL